MSPFLITLEKRFSKMAKVPRGVWMVVAVEMGLGPVDIRISRSDYAKCHSRKERYQLIESVIRGKH